ncbi:hypothetical protein BGX27_009875 [Mortierella sp. AM989]|nr:hypothetical protein BGX27_009875 [Mortierella sp. AM989]
MNPQYTAHTYDAEYRYSQGYVEDNEVEQYTPSTTIKTTKFMSTPAKTSTSPLRLHHSDSNASMNLDKSFDSNAKGSATGMKDMTTTIDMTEYPEDRNDDGFNTIGSFELEHAMGQRPTSSLQSHPQPQYSKNHYGYDLQEQKQREQQQQQQQQQYQRQTNANTQQKDNDQSFKHSNTVVQRQLSTVHLQQQHRQQQQQRQQQGVQQQQQQVHTNLDEQERVQRERQTHHRAITEGADRNPDPGESETTTTILVSSLGEIPSLSNPGTTIPSSVKLPVSGDRASSADYSINNSAAVTPIEQTFPHQKPHYAGPRSRSGSMSSTPLQQPGAQMSSPSVPVPPLPAYLQQQQQQSAQTPGRSIVVNIHTLASPGKTGWERDDCNSATPTTPTPNYGLGGNDSKKNGGSGSQSQTPQQHSTSLFDFLRGRKSSIPKNSAQHHQAAAAATAAASVIAAGAAAAAATTATSSSNTTPNPPNNSNSGSGNIPLMNTPPSISKSRMGPVMGPLIQPPGRKQSMDVHALQANQQRVLGYNNTNANSSGNGANTMSMSMSMVHNMGGVNASNVSRFDRQTPAFPASMTAVAGASPTCQQSSLPANSSTESVVTVTKSSQSTFSRVAAAVVGATVGKRRPSVVSELEAGTSKQKNGSHDNQSSFGSGLIQKQVQELDQEHMNNHAAFMRTEKTMSELTEYIDRLYHTVLNKDVALEYSKKQASVLQKELEQTRSRVDDDKKSFVDEVDRVKEQIVTMEENFLLWRTKVYNDQMIQQENFLHERLVNQDRIEELEEDLISSREEVTRLRNRLLILEYEDGYTGPNTFLSEGDITSNSSCSNNVYNISTNDDNNSSKDGNGNSNSNSRRASTSVTIGYGPMTIAAHKRRSGDFMTLEKKAQSFEAQVQELQRLLEIEKQDRQRDLMDSRMRMHEKCVKLEQEAQAAKMESTMYTEMMYEVVSENDSLRKKVKDAQRRLQRQEAKIHNHSGSGSSMNDGDSIYGSEDDMEDIMI